MKSSAQGHWYPSRITTTMNPRSNLSGIVYGRIKDDIVHLRLLPSERFTESEVASRMGVSRTPVREALYKLAQEGYIEVSSRHGWTVKAFDFELYDNLYDVRVILEIAAVEKLCSMDELPTFEELRSAWLVPEEARLDDDVEVARLDERFHESLVETTGNLEMIRIYHGLTERIHIVRGLAFTQPDHIARTYEEHAQILRSILGRNAAQASRLLRSHIETSKAALHSITLHKLHSARTSS